MNLLLWNFESLNNLIFIIFLMNYVPNQNWKVLEETRASSNSDAMKIILKRLLYFKMTFPLLREFYECCSRLKCNIQIGMLLVQIPWVLG